MHVDVYFPIPMDKMLLFANVWHCSTRCHIIRALNGGSRCTSTRNEYVSGCMVGPFFYFLFVVIVVLLSVVLNTMGC